MKRSTLRLITTAWIAALVSPLPVARAESPNPFGTPGGGAGAQGDPDFFNDPGPGSPEQNESPESFGGPPPGVPRLTDPVPTPSVNAPPVETAPSAPPQTRPASPNRRSTTPRTASPTVSPSAAPPSAPNTSSFSPPPGTGIPGGSPPPSTPASSGKPPAKLADYLELDSAVKGLEVKNFDLPDKEIRDVVTLISKWTGKNFILDSKVRGKITVLGPSQVTLQEAYHAFLSALEANGLTTVQSGKFIRIIESAEARRAPVETYAGDYAPETDQFITRIFQLKYINADEVQREFRDLTTRQGKLFAYEPTNSIIITDTGSNIKRIQGILDTLDVKGFETTLHVMRIKHTSAKSIAEMLDEIYGAEGRSGSAGGASRARSFRRSSLERTRGGGIISKIIPDEQTNSLLVLANRAGFEQLGQLVRKLDVRVTDTGRIHVYYCEHAKAEDLAATLASLAGGGSSGASSSKSSSRSSRSNSAAGSTNVGGSTTPARTGPVSAELEGGAKITSDAATNSLVITANSGDYQTLKRVIKKLDIPRLQVFVETAILEVNVDRTTGYGVNLGSSGPGRAFTGGFIGDPSSLTSFLNNGAPSAGLSIPIVGGPVWNDVPITIGGVTQRISTFTFMGMLRLLTTQTNSSILSTPQIIALDNEKAEFKVQDETPVQTSFVAAVGQGGAGSIGAAGQGSIENKKTGIEINLTPHVNAASRSIRMEIEQKIDSIRNAADVPDSLKGVQIATTSRVTNTTVVVKDQDYVMLGGLMSDKIDETVRKVPLLGDIPILGWLFKAKDFKTVKSNLVILLRPRIIGTSVSAANIVSDRLEKRDKFVSEHSGGSEKHEEGLASIKADVERQKGGQDADPLDRYRNNNLQDDDDSVETSGSDDRIKPDPQKGSPKVSKAPSATDAPAALPEAEPTYEIPGAGE